MPIVTDLKSINEAFRKVHDTHTNEQAHLYQNFLLAFNILREN